ncbi:flotillin family protein [Cesiribacter andamanensis]|uniref:Inner membrane protein yqiK n=1 Tax=Cesiribacter andamanensis AMV16 TaxID=1279009 RepID=M7N050_9BACT|nr:hypothetical protein [Cesiribacter andamanensis]EMR02068.1 Inner membrane protein yqiK [Cesiribacter andamanensis AMV16]
MESIAGNAVLMWGLITIGFLFAIAILIARLYRKAEQGQALVVTGMFGPKVSFSGTLVWPVIQRLEVMDITVKTIMINRTGKEGLICRDNMRADIKVTFFVRVNSNTEDVMQVAQSIGCSRASDHHQLELLFDAKFSEALKAVGKRFQFVDLYTNRQEFKDEILQVIGRDLNGYILDDCAIDYLEQTPLEFLNESNILDAEGIKKIIDLTARQKTEANFIEREKEKTLKKQDVEAKETVLQLERQQIESEEKQRREIAAVRARERAEAERIEAEERLKAEAARITTDEQLAIAEQNKERQVLVAQRSKEKTDAIELERVVQARELEANERERVVSLAQIEKEKALEIEKRNIQEVIRERVVVEKATVEEQERIKDTVAHAGAEREKHVALVNAAKEAEEKLVKEIKAAEAARQAAEHEAKKAIIDAEAERKAADMRADSIKIMAEAEARQAAALGLSEAQVMEAKALALAKQGKAEASVITDKADAEAKAIRATGDAQAEANTKLGQADATVIRAKAEAQETQGEMEARIMEQKFMAEAKGIAEKARAMSALDGPGKEHEEFKLRLEKDKQVELAGIDMQKELAEAQAMVLAEGLKKANIDIIGGESMFFQNIVGSMAKGKAIDGMIGQSSALQDVKNTFFSPDANGNVDFKSQLRQFLDKFGMTSEDVRNLSISALLLKMTQSAESDSQRTALQELNKLAGSIGMADKPVSTLNL